MKEDGRKLNIVDTCGGGSRWGVTQSGDAEGGENIDTKRASLPAERQRGKAYSGFRRGYC